MAGDNLDHESILLFRNGNVKVSKVTYHLL